MPDASCVLAQQPNAASWSSSNSVLIHEMYTGRSIDDNETSRVQRHLPPVYGPKLRESIKFEVTSSV